ncbi:MAG: hypothetical protein ACI9XR_000586 [Flavobacterium sp.]|jgi:uncharacterized protein YqgC (DUF456 family)
MDFIYVIIGLLFCLLGLVGSFLPSLPGVFLSWIGLLFLYFTSFMSWNFYVLGSTLLIAIILSVLEYVIPAKSAQYLGGTKYGIWGTNIGLVFGLFFPPIGFIIGLFVGAFVGELIYNYKDKKNALRAAFGAFIGFLVSTFMELMVCLCFLILFVVLFFKHFNTTIIS